MLRAALLVLLLCAPLAYAQDEPEPVDRAEIEKRIQQIRESERHDLRRAAAKKAVVGVSEEELLAIVRDGSAFEAVESGRHNMRVLSARGRITMTPMFVPSGYTPETPVPLLLALHGAGGNGNSLLPMWQEAAEELGMIVLAPNAGRVNEGYTFGAGERNMTLAAVRTARRDFNIDENRIHVTGISRGGHLAWDLILRFPDLWASATPMIGGPRLSFSRGENNTRFVENITGLTIRDLQGAKDDPRLVASLRMMFARLEELGARDARLVEFPEMGHEFQFGAIRWPLFLAKPVRDPLPQKVVRRVALPQEGRAFWIEVLKVDRSVRDVLRPEVNPKKWAAMGESEQRAEVFRQAEGLTARIEAEITGVGEFTVRTKLVKSFRILLDRSMFDPEKPVVVTVNGRKHRKVVKVDVAVLAQDIAERHDRTFLPVAEVVLRP